MVKKESEGVIMKKLFLLVLLCISMTGCTAVVPTSSHKPTASKEELLQKQEESIDPVVEEEVPAPPEPKVDRVRIAAVGDIMVHKWQLTGAYDAKKQAYDFTPCFAEVKEALSSADLTIGNLETTFGGKERGYTGYPRFSSPDQLADVLQDVGFDILTTANNHCLDSSEKGLLRTLDILEDRGISALGTYRTQEERDAVYLREVNGISFAFLAYTYSTNGLPIPQNKPYMVSMIDLPRMKEDIQKAKAMSPDFVVVNLHFGDEYKIFPNDKQKEMVDELFAAGADVILGGHPHVLQPMETRKIKNTDGTERTGFVVYSLGNFISSMRTPPTDAGIILYLDFEKIEGQRGELKQVSIIPTWVQFTRKNGNYLVRVLSTYDALHHPEEKMIENLQKHEITRIKQVQSETVSHMIYGTDAKAIEASKWYIYPMKP